MKFIPTIFTSCAALIACALSSSHSSAGNSQSIGGSGGAMVAVTTANDTSWFKGTVPNGSGVSTWYDDGCAGARVHAMAGKPGVGCTMSASMGFVDIEFDIHGLPVFVTGFDSSGKGYHYEITSHKAVSPPPPGYKVNRVQMVHSVSYYESPAPSTTTALGSSNLGANGSAVIPQTGNGKLDSDGNPVWAQTVSLQGRTFVRAQTVTTYTDLTEHFVSVYTATPTEADDCTLYYRSAEGVATAANPTVLVQHDIMTPSSGHLLHHDEARWDGIHAMGFKCGSGITKPASVDFYKDVSDRFINPQLVQVYFNQAYSAWGVTASRPLSLFAAAHLRRVSPQFKTLSDKGDRHAEAEIMNAILQAGSAAGLAMMFGGPLAPEIGAATFFIVFDASLGSSLIQDWENGCKGATCGDPQDEKSGDDPNGPNSTKDGNDGVTTDESVNEAVADAENPAAPDPGGGADDGAAAVASNGQSGDPSVSWSCYEDCCAPSSSPALCCYDPNDDCPANALIHIPTTGSGSTTTKTGGGGHGKVINDDGT